MSKESYVKFETAKLLREKGFDWDTDKVYERNIMACRYEDYPMPTQATACRWLRKRGIHIMPTIGCDVDRTPRIFYGAVIALFNDYGDIDYRDPLDENGYNEPEDAIEVALQYCLTNLI